MTPSLRQIPVLMGHPSPTLAILPALQGSGLAGPLHWNLFATPGDGAAKVSRQGSIKHSRPCECCATKFAPRIRGDRGVIADLQSVFRISYHGIKDMVAVIAGDTLSTSVANEAARLLSLIIESMHIVDDDGNTVTISFAATNEVHDTLCIWAADAELDEDDGTAEEDFRTHPRVFSLGERSLGANAVPVSAAARVDGGCNHAEA